MNIRNETKDLHDKVDSTPFVQNMIDGKQSPFARSRWLMSQYKILESLDSHVELQYQRLDHLKNDLLELPVMSPAAPASAYQKHIRGLSDPNPHIYLNYMALLFGGQILKKHYPTSSSVYQFPHITEARSYFRTFVPTDLSPDYISEVRKGFQFQLAIISEISQNHVE